MKSEVSILEFRNEIVRYQSFAVSLLEPTSPVKFKVYFDRVAICLAPYPYIALRGDSGELTIRHITSIYKECDGVFCTYIFACLDLYSVKDKVEVDFQVECFT